VLRSPSASRTSPSSIDLASSPALENGARLRSAALVLGAACSVWCFVVPSDAAAEPASEPAKAATPDDGVVPEGSIEIIAGGKRRVVPSTITSGDDDVRRERGVLPIRGTTIGAATLPIEINRKSVSSSARARLRRQLDALIRVHRDTFDLPIDEQLEADLRVLHPVEDRGPNAPPLLRARFLHDEALPDPRFYRETERFLVTRALHASSHAVIARHATHAPFWLDEGLAVALEGIAVEGERIVAELTDEHRERITRQRRTGAGFELARLLELDAQSFRRLPRGEAADLQSALGSLVLFLLEEHDVHDGIAAGLRGEPALLPTREPMADEGALEREWLDWQRAPRTVELRAPPDPATVPEPRRTRIRREIRCVPGVVGAGTSAERAVLFCTRVQVRRAQ